MASNQEQIGKIDLLKLMEKNIHQGIFFTDNLALFFTLH